MTSEFRFHPCCRRRESQENVQGSLDQVRRLTHRLTSVTEAIVPLSPLGKQGRLYLVPGSSSFGHERLARPESLARENPQTILSSEISADSGAVTDWIWGIRI
jgi:hypothetical protein